MRGNLKISPWPIIRAHHETYVDARNGRPRISDYVLLDALPIVVMGVLLWRGVKLNAVASGALLTVTGLLSALLFGVMLQITERAMEWVDDPPKASRETSEHVLFMGEVAANAGYASLVCVGAAIAFALATMMGHRKLEIASAVGLGLGTHLILVLLLVIRRVFALIENRLMRVRTGADQKVVAHRRHTASGGS